MAAVDAPDAPADIHTGDPYPVYERLRRSEPAYRTRSGAYLLTRYPDCLRVLTARASFPAAEPARAENAQDPRRHARMRTAVARRFRRHVRRQEPWIAARCDQLLDPVVESLRSGGVVDITGLAEAFPRDALVHLLGLPRGDRDLVSALIAAIFPASGPMPGQGSGSGAAAMRQLTDYLRAEVARRRHTPGDDLMSELVQTHTHRPELLPHDELISMLTGFMVAGYPQVTAGIETGVVLMVRHPHQTVYLNCPATARMFVDEVLRYDAPVQFPPVPRISTRAVLLGGVPVPAGAQVWPLLGAANRDPGTFSQPDEFSPGREAARHLSFGADAHHCLGAELVYAEMSMVLCRLRRRVPGLELAAPPVHRLGGLRGFTSVPVRSPER
ncbi:cytochrome P450 [Streptomyces sp. SYSU K217416]